MSSDPSGAYLLLCPSRFGPVLGTLHVCECGSTLDHEWHWCPCGADWTSEEQSAYQHEHDDDEGTHDDCSDCGSLDPMRMCRSCLTYMAEDQR